MAGPTAPMTFRAAGYRAWLLPTPSRPGPADADLARALVGGWETAAVEQLRAAADDEAAVARQVRAWAERRCATIASGRFGLMVGHLDLLALPA